MSDFKSKQSKLLNADRWNGLFGVKKGTRYHTRAGLSSLYSEVYFLSEIDDEDLEELPDHVLSETLQADLESSIVACIHGLKSAGFLHKDTDISTVFGAIPEGQREGVNVEDWRDYQLHGNDGTPLYTEEMLSNALDSGSNPLAFALSLIVRSICDGGGFLSKEWYFARIAHEYFGHNPLPNRSAYLIGELFKELCLKQQYEGDLQDYYDGLRKAKNDRAKGARKNADKAEELRAYCVDLCARLASTKIALWSMAQDELRANELRTAALKERPEDFKRGGLPYSKEWFLRNVIEDRRIEIVDALAKIQGEDP